MIKVVLYLCKNPSCRDLFYGKLTQGKIRGLGESGYEVGTAALKEKNGGDQDIEIVGVNTSDVCPRCRTIGPPTLHAEITHRPSRVMHH